MELTFSGAHDEDVTRFLQQVQQDAWIEGRARNNALLADVVSASLTGDALRWYCELDMDVQLDWAPLRAAMLRRFISRAPNRTSTLSNAPPLYSDLTNTPEGTPNQIVRTALHLDTITASSIAATAWATSKRFGNRGIRLYRPENGAIRELCDSSDNGNGWYTWTHGAQLNPSVKVSKTAPIAAANSFGLGWHDHKEQIIVYFISRDNHLRAFQFDGRWKQRTLDIPLNGNCTGLAAHCHVNQGIDTVWSVCYSSDQRLYLRQERYRPAGEMTLDFHTSSQIVVGEPSPSVGPRLRIRDAVLSSHEIVATLGRHRTIGVDLRADKPHSSDREKENMDEKSFQESDEIWGPIPCGSMWSDGPIAVANWLTAPRKTFVFFLHSGNQIVYCVHDDSAGWQPETYAVQV